MVVIQLSEKLAIFFPTRQQKRQTTFFEIQTEFHFTNLSFHEPRPIQHTPLQTLYVLLIPYKMLLLSQPYKEGTETYLRG